MKHSLENSPDRMADRVDSNAATTPGTSASSVAGDIYLPKMTIEHLGQFKHGDRGFLKYRQQNAVSQNFAFVLQEAWPGAVSCLHWIGAGSFLLAIFQMTCVTFWGLFYLGERMITPD